MVMIIDIIVVRVADNIMIRIADKIIVMDNVFYQDNRKLDGVGPVDNRPSTDKVHHFVWKKKKKNCDM